MTSECQTTVSSQGLANLTKKSSDCGFISDSLLLHRNAILVLAYRNWISRIKG
jgi:hypothetical protein